METNFKMANTVQSTSGIAYKNALFFERKGNIREAVKQFQIAADQNHLLALLRLAQIFDEGKGFSPDRTRSEKYFRAAAKVPGTDEIMKRVYDESSADAPVFIALMAKAFLIASDSARYTAHAFEALKWYFVLTTLNYDHLVEEPESYDVLMRTLPTEQIDKAQVFAESWIV